MLTEEERKFIVYWERVRLSHRTFGRQLSFGLPLGLLMGVGILVCFETGWYTRANMVANSQSTPYVLVLAIAGITVFCSVFYQKYQWEQKEQRYKELIYKQQKEDNKPGHMQQ